MQYFLSIFIGTFVLEDLALASSIALMSENKISPGVAFLACFLGISIGDIGLYLIGFFSTKLNLEKRFHSAKKIRNTLSKMKQSGTLTYSILISRIIPGTRLPTYVAAGYLKYSFWKFTYLTIFSVGAWVAFALFAGKSLNYLLMDHLILSLILFLLFLHLVKTFIPRLIDPWERQALLYSWRKWLHFEFWPAWFFYLPIVPYYIYLSTKYRSFLIPFYANPNLQNGGLIGESKWDFLKHLDVNDTHTLKAIHIPRHADFLSLRELLDKQGFNYPFILKPDIGQRGFGVRIIRDDFDLTEYLLLSDFDLLAQKLSQLPGEAGLFYIRKPAKISGSLYSITDKKFPAVIGDGHSKLGTLILKDSRARIIAATYFARLKDKLNEVPGKNQIVPIAECGNHCQGAIFLNGENFQSAKLTEAVEKIARQIPDFYFGRFDVRYLNPESLKNGSFEIVEVNGAGSEATHIWDARTKLSDAYRTLFVQWETLFSIGAEVKKARGTANLRLGAFLKESFKVFFRKDALSVSS